MSDQLKHDGLQLVWGPKEIEDLRKQVAQMDEENHSWER
jgi:hypothetical protein